MSRGIGKFQRQIITAGGATRTVWDVLPAVSFEVFHDSALPGLRDTGHTWRADGKPYFKGKATASSLAEYVALCTTYRYVTVERPRSKYLGGADIVVDDAFAAACWLEDSIYLSIYPQLFAVDHRQPTHIKRADGRDVWAQMMLPDEIRKAKASAKSNVVRAMRSLVQRHRASGVFQLYPPSEVAEARGWKARYGKRGQAGCWARLVLHPDAVAHGSDEPVVSATKAGASA
jgi:hypothetical protein